MDVSLGHQVEYKLPLESGEYRVNEWIDRTITLRFGGEIHCCKCGKRTKNSFGEGFCFPCFQTAPEASPCIIKPELCRAHLGEGRDVEWEQRNHNQPHVVYLAASDVVKVGITRASNVPNRWIDQGAAYAIILAETPNRYEAGLIEVALKDQFTDKTNWRKMLSNVVDHDLDLEEVKWELHECLPSDLTQFFSDRDEVTHIHYPVLDYPTKVNSLSLDKLPEVTGKLLGIKGQYWMFDGGRVMNIRKHTSYLCEIEVSNG